MKKLLLSILIGFYFQTFAQSKFSAGVIGSMDITALSYTQKGINNTNQFYDVPKFGYQYGLRTRYDFTKKFSLHTGFSLVTHQVGSRKIYTNPLANGDSKVPLSITLNNNIKIVQIPLLASFYFGNNIRFGFTTGVSYNYIFRNNQHATADFWDGTRETKHTSKITSQNQYISAIAGVGVEYTHKHFIFRAEPTGTGQLYFFDNEFANTNFRLWSVGLALSTYYRF